MEITIPIRLTSDDLFAIASAVVAALKPSLDQLKQDIEAMSQTVSQQLVADVDAIKGLVTRVLADVQAVADRLAAGTVSQADIDQLNTAVGDLRGAVDQLDAVAVPPAPPTP